MTETPHLLAATSYRNHKEDDMTVVGESEKKVTETSREKDENVEQKDNLFEKMDESTKIPPDKAPDGVLAQSELPGKPKGSDDIRRKINSEAYTEEELEIRPDEKDAFVESLLTGSRHYQTYTIFGGRIKVTIRSRTIAETQAMYAYMRHTLTKDASGLATLEGDMSYLLLAAQIDELNGTKYPEMQEPLTFIEKDGKEYEPGWLGCLNTWKAKPEGLTNALINRVQLFEYKYWTMVSEASNRNFWTPETSTAV